MELDIFSSRPVGIYKDYDEKFYNVLIKSSLLYVSKIWKVTKNSKRRFDVTEMDALRTSSRI
jgi:hypothetical protein